MSLFSWIVEFVLHLDAHLNTLITAFGAWSYAFLFLVIFCETGLVVLPFLPGDSLLFASGALAATGSFNIWLLFVVLFLAATLGDSMNYFFGKKLGIKVFKKFLKEEYIDKTHKFFEKYGSKTIVIARFVPFVRTFAPFFAGVGKMSYWKFLSYNIIGGFVWVALFVFGGYFFGNLPLVKHHFGTFIIAIILVSLVPVLYEFIRHKLKKK